MSETVVCPTCGAILSRGEPDRPAEPTPAPAAVAVDSADGLDPISVSLASSEPDPILRVGAASVSSIDPEEVPKRRGPSWPIVLLGSYASAMTLACGWLFWERNRGHERAMVDSSPMETRPDPGLRADQSRQVAAPIPAERRTTLGKPIRVGSLEVTPLEARSDRVTLEHVGPVGGVHVKRGGGTKALRLRVRLRNLSTDTIFAPLDESFVREHERGEPESFIINGTGERIPLYPLAVQSEWSIVGQEFRALKPGEAMETWIVSAADEALDRAAPPLTWSLRLRTGIDRTDVVGVRIVDDTSKTTKERNRRPYP